MIVFITARQYTDLQFHANWEVARCYFIIPCLKRIFAKKVPRLCGSEGSTTALCSYSHEADRRQ